MYKILSKMVYMIWCHRSPNVKCTSLCFHNIRLVDVSDPVCALVVRRLTVRFID